MLNFHLQGSEEDPLDEYHRLLNKEHDSDMEFDSEEEVESEFTILGAPSEPSWVPPKNALKFYLKVADLELSKEVIKDIESKFKTNDDLDEHFHPPKFPTPFWNVVQSSPADSYKLKALHKVQENIYLAIKPLLKSLESVPKPVKDDIT